MPVKVANYPGGLNMQFAQGMRLGPYEICAVLGVGGMGEVYKARDSRLERFVAVKVLLADKLGDAEHRRRLTIEARAASALNHPGIVTIYDVGSACGMDYIAMEFIEGNTLDKLIPRNGLPFSELLRYSAQAADAIAAAHVSGVLHRDLKPCNLIVTGGRQIKILDFGLARLLGTGPEHERVTCSVLEGTIRGTVMGTAAYMSPEQAEGKPLDCRSDIFSFGAMLYEMLTGQRAFGGDTPISTIASILRDEPKPIQEARPQTPPELERLVLRCLRKDPARRTQSMSELKIALEELKEELDSGQHKVITTVALVPARMARTLWLLLAVCACGLVAFAAIRYSGGSGCMPVRPATKAVTAGGAARTCAQHCAER